MAYSKLTTKANLVPFILITSLFFLWGMAHGMLDVMNKHFQEILQISKARSGMLQFAMYMAYFSMALPAGYFMRRFGYKNGILLGLFLFSVGSLLIAGTTSFESFWVFLCCLFVMGCGLTTLETAANPYTTKLGPSESAARRINLSQSFNGMAWTVGPLIGLFIYGNHGARPGEKLSSLTMPYFIIGLVVFLVGLVFFFTKLPEIKEESITEDKKVVNERRLINERHLVLGVIAQFAYCAAQTGIFSYLINFVTDEKNTPHFSADNGPYLLSIGFALFMLGRMSGSYIMSFVRPSRLLAIYAVACCVLLPVVSANLGWMSIVSLYLIFFFMSIMFPTIFAMGINGLGHKTKKASSFIVMSIVGGAIFPPLMGWVADTWSMSVGFLSPIPFFIYILFYAVNGSIVKPTAN